MPSTGSGQEDSDLSEKIGNKFNAIDLNILDHFKDLLLKQQTPNNDVHGDNEQYSSPQ